MIDAAMLSTTRLALLTAALLLCSAEAKAYSCFKRPLPQLYESTEIVFIAKVGARSEIDSGLRKGKYLWAFEISEIFKGKIGFDTLETLGPGNCSACLIEGHEYLIFTGPKGTVGGCNYQHPIIDRPDNQAWVEVLRAFKSGQIASLTEPWIYSELPKDCGLSQKFVNGEAWLHFNYRFSDVELFDLRVWFPEHEYVVEGTGRLLIGDKTWTTRRKPSGVPTLPPDEFIDTAQAYEVLTALEAGTSIKLQATIADDPYSASYRNKYFPNYPSLNTEIPFPFLGDALEKFKKCLRRGNLPTKNAAPH